MADLLAEIKNRQPVNLLAELNQPAERMPTTPEYGQTVPSVIGEGYEDIPQVDAQGNPIYDDYLNERPAPSLGERAYGAVEAAKTIGTGATAGLVGGLAGTLKGLGDVIASGKYGTPEGADEVARLQQQYAASVTDTPDTPEGRRYVEAIGGLFESLPPILGAGQAGAISSSMRGVAGRGLKGSLNEFLLSKSPTKQKIAQLVEQNADDVQRAGFIKRELPSGEIKTVKDKAYKEAKNQGMNELTISMIESSSKADKKAMRKAIDNLKAGRVSRTASITKRPGDAAGDVLKQRYDAVRKINRRAGEEVDAAARGLKGNADLSEAYSGFTDKLLDYGVNVIRGKDGKLRGIYENSILADSKSSQNILNKFLALSEKTNVPAKQAHLLKKRLQKLIDFESKKSNRTVMQDAESALNDLQRGINGVLRKSSQKYAAANDKFSDTIEAIRDFEKVAGRSFDPGSKNASGSLSRTARKMMSNQVSREPAIDAINNLEQTAKKYGSKFDDDILKQVAFMDDLETLFGSSAPASFGGQIEKAASRAIRGDGMGLIAEAAEAGVKKYKGINEENLIKAIEELLK